MKSFKILLVGDIYAKPGRETLSKYLPKLIDIYSPTAIIVNGENAAHGFGIRPNMVKEIFSEGVDVITTGNHVWDHKDIIQTFAEEKNLLRPENYSGCQPGKGVVDIDVKIDGETKKIRVINLAGRICMGMANSPFEEIKNLIGEGTPVEQNLAAIIVDFHAEVTAEKAALAYFVDGRCTAVVGTHTHVPTADHRVLEKGTGFMTDLGMTGTYSSVIGMNKDHSISRFLGYIPKVRSEPAEGQGVLCGALVTVSKETGLCISIEPVRMGHSLSESLPKTPESLPKT